MIGPDVIARTMSQTRSFGSGRNTSHWQYNPRSDHHSKLACWGIAVDLLAASSLMRTHAAAGKITIGVNHEMVDFKNNRKKDLDLVIARPADHQSQTKPMDLADIAQNIGAVLSPTEQALFASLPKIMKQPVGSVLVALEAKACMTEHKKSEPRLYDELNSSQQTVHGAADQAIAVGLATVNVSPTFVSPLRATGSVTQHRQPTATEKVIAKLRQLPRRSGLGQDGFDALGILVVDIANDGSPVTVCTVPPAPQPGDIDTYSAMITRAAALYDYRFSSI